MPRRAQANKADSCFTPLLRADLGVRTAMNRQIQILIVEEEEQVRRLIATILERAGYRTLSAADTAQALRTFSDTKPDLVLLDTNLPDASGWQLCRYLREVWDTPIVILSCAAQEEDLVRGLEAGADDYITKPFGSRVLVARIGAVLRRASGERGGVRPAS